MILSDVNVVGDGIISSGAFGPGFRSLQDGWLSFLSRPGEAFSFATLELAQAIGDFQSLDAAGRRALHVHLPAPSATALRAVFDALLELR